MGPPEIQSLSKWHLIKHSGKEGVSTRDRSIAHAYRHKGKCKPHPHRHIGKEESSMSSYS